MQHAATRTTVQQGATTALYERRPDPEPRPPDPGPLATVHHGARCIDIALLGLGHVGSAVASLALADPEASAFPIRLVGALVRDAERPRGESLHRRVRLTEDPARLLAARPDVLIEVLGGLEPARTLVLGALDRGIPVVTANKSLMAAHGDELLGAACETGTTLRYEASVLAGVPFLGTFANRPLAARISAVTGIINGTTNYILTKMERERQDFSTALAEAQRLGFAEPDPASDIDGADAVEKLTVLLRHFGRRSVAPATVETTGLRAVQPLDLSCAREFGGALKFIAHAEWRTEGVRAFVGPTFVPSSSKLSRIDGVENAVSLASDVAGELFYSGPGAGPAVTAATILDDVAECVASRGNQPPAPRATRATPDAPATGWFVRVSEALPPADGAGITDLLASFGVLLKRISPVRTTTGRAGCYALTWPASRERLERALGSLRGATGCDATAFRALEG